MAVPITPPVARLQAEVFGRFPTSRNLGTYNCRKIRGSTTWSQHAWGNALDIGIGSNLALGDQIKAWVDANKSRLGLGTVLWRTTDHYDHLHVEGSPKLRGTPTCAGGPPVTEDFRPVPVGATPTEPAEPTEAPTPGLFGPAIDVVKEGTLRVGMTVGGAVLVILGLIFLYRELGGPLPPIGPLAALGKASI